MKRFSVLGAVVALLAGAGVLSGAEAAPAGNGAPSGAHYNLNIIGMKDPKSTDMTGSNGHSIFVPLKGSCKINLYEGDFQTLDRNCTDGSPAAFQLPNPDPGNTGTTVYSVYARALGKPGGDSRTTTCFVDDGGTRYCSIYQMVLVRGTGQSSFDNVSQELLYVYYCDTSTGKIVRESLFNHELYDYYWQYENNGLRLAQLRFYPGEQTTVAPAGADC